jgi:hypothetical protein
MDDNGCQFITEKRVVHAPEQHVIDPFILEFKKQIFIAAKKIETIIY